MKKKIMGICDIILYVIVFFVLQIISMAVFTFFAKDQAVLMTLTSLLSSALTIVLFFALKWTPFNLNYISRRPWKLLICIVFLTIGTLFPSTWMEEMMGIEMNESLEQVFEGIMRQPVGFFVLALLVPVAEEMVFRGAVLHTLLKLFEHIPYYKEVGDRDYFKSNSYHWYAIILSAFVFSMVHGNLAQGVHAFITALLLGWLYYRTNSIIPGIVMHWVNNSAAAAMTCFCPDSDKYLIDLFQGNEVAMYSVIALSFVVAIISLWLTIKNI